MRGIVAWVCSLLSTFMTQPICSSPELYQLTQVLPLIASSSPGTQTARAFISIGCANCLRGRRLLLTRLAVFQ